jgi:hypothetical protein
MLPSGCANALAVGSLHRPEHTEAASMDEHACREHGRAWRPRAWTSMEAASMDEHGGREHGGRERAEGANGCRQFHDNPQKLRRRESAGQD